MGVPLIYERSGKQPLRIPKISEEKPGEGALFSDGSLVWFSVWSFILGFRESARSAG
jgi:hypothetical protein